MNIGTSEVLLAIQKSLLGEITPSLRAVCVEHINNTVTINAFYDQPPTEDEIESISCVETEMMAALPEYFAISYAIHIIAADVALPDMGTYVYSINTSFPRRRESLRD